jgi:hypothetical protein
VRAAGRWSPSRRAVLGGAIAVGALAALDLALDSDEVTEPEVRVFGATGSFSGLSRISRLSGGHRITTVGVPSWRFDPGQAAFGCIVAPGGSVLIGTTPFTDNQLKPTGADMQIAALESDPPRFESLVIPSTKGETILAGGLASGVGGGDVSALVSLPHTSPPRVLFVSMAPYQGWDISTAGELPSVGQLVSSKDGWSYDARRSLTASALANAAAPSIADLAFPVLAGARNSRGTADVVILPHSGHAIVAQYFGHGAALSGALFALDTASGKVVAFWQLPATVVFGQTVTCHPRQLAADPSSAPGDERFVLICDTFDTSGAIVPFPLQEFSYQRQNGTITPKSTAVRAAQDGSRMEMAQFLPDGTLVVARTKPDGLIADQLAVYEKRGAERSLVQHPPALSVGQDGLTADAAFGATCPPDFLVPGTDRGGLVRSFTVDPRGDGLYLGGLNGFLQTVTVIPGTGAKRFRVGAALDLRLDLLRTPQHYAIGIRQGAIDPERRILWLPCNQLTLDRQAWPVTPFPLDQWIYAISLDKLT